MTYFILLKQIFPGDDKETIEWLNKKNDHDYDPVLKSLLPDSPPNTEIDDTIVNINNISVLSPGVDPETTAITLNFQYDDKHPYILLVQHRLQDIIDALRDYENSIRKDSHIVIIDSLVKVNSHGKHATVDSGRAK